MQLSNNTNISNNKTDYQLNVAGDNVELKPVSDETKETLEAYQKAYQRWGAAADDADLAGLQAVTTDDHSKTQDPRFIAKSPSQSVASFFAPLVNIFRIISNFFTNIIAKQGIFRNIEARTSENFYNSIAKIFNGNIPKPVLRSMHTHRNGYSWCTLTTLDIQRVMKKVRNFIENDKANEGTDIKDRFDDLEAKAQGRWKELKKNGVYITRKEATEWQKNNGISIGYDDNYSDYEEDDNAGTHEIREEDVDNDS